MPRSQGAYIDPVYLHKQSPTQLLWQKQLNLSCFVSTWFLLSLWLFACPSTMEAGEWQQIVGMHLNETNYYMLTAFTMAHLKELGSFTLALQDSLLKKSYPFDCLYFWAFFLFPLLLLSVFHPPSPPSCHKGSCKSGCLSWLWLL